jgi:hypothetical protein
LGLYSRGQPSVKRRVTGAKSTVVAANGYMATGPKLTGSAKQREARFVKTASFVRTYFALIFGHGSEAALPFIRSFVLARRNQIFRIGREINISSTKIRRALLHLQLSRYN